MLSLLHLLRLLPIIFSLPSLPLASPTKITGTWTILNFERYCTPLSCVYNFFIAEDNSTTSHCNFATTAAPGSKLFANRTDFAEVRCTGVLNYRVNGGWNETGFLTLVVTNTQENTDAFFGFEDQEIENEKVVLMQTRPAYVRGTFAADDGLEEARKEEETPRVKRLVKSGLVWAMNEET